MCNVSLIIYLQSDKICYIHGKNNFGSGEGTLALIYKKLQLESKNSVKNRGILENDSHQVFEITHNNFKLNEKQKENANLNKSEKFLTEKNYFLEAIKEKLLSPNLTIKNKTFNERFLGTLFKASLNNNNFEDISIYKEKNNFINDFFLSGLWLDFLINSAILIAFFDKVIQSLPVASFITILFCFFYVGLRNFLGIKNLVKNNGIDQRFLI